MGSIGGPEILLILLVIVLLFGARKLPEAARSLGRSMRIFKSEVHEMRNEGEERAGARQQLPEEQVDRGRPAGEVPAEAQAQIPNPAAGHAAPARPEGEDQPRS